MIRTATLAFAAALAIFSQSAVVLAQTPAAAAPPTPQAAPAVPAQAPGTTMEKLSGVWIEGPGFEINYGGNYDGCTKRCLANPKCAMIEYYRPEKKCNLYNAVRPRKTGGSSDVGIRR
jgi:PAN domain